MTEPNILGNAHFLVGCFAIISGFTAFSTKKGMKLHRIAGEIFVISMTLLTLSGLWLSIARGILFTVFLSAIAFHAFITGWAAAGINKTLLKWITKLSSLSSGAITVGAVYGGILAASAPNGTLNDLPPAAFYTIACFSFLLFSLDLNFTFDTNISTPKSITRHLWRMGFSFFLATGIFFFGNNHVLPEILRTTAILSAPVIVVVLWTLYFALRTRFWKFSEA